MSQTFDGDAARRKAARKSAQDAIKGSVIKGLREGLPADDQRLIDRFVKGPNKSDIECALTRSADFTVVWDPKVVEPKLYAELVTALGDVARAVGGLGVERIAAQGFGVPAGSVVPT